VLRIDAHHGQPAVVLPRATTPLEDLNLGFRVQGLGFKV
jgi:hypothetical protein